MRPVEDVKREIQEIGVKASWGEERILKSLPNILYEDEHLKGLATGNKSAMSTLMTGPTDIVLVCTSRRVLLIEKKLIKSKTEEIPLDQVGTIERKDGLLLSKVIILTTGNKKIQLNDLSKKEALDFCTAVQQAKTLMVQLVSGTGPKVAAVSMGDQLRDLKDLLDQGILTEEEFEMKKKQILSM